MRFVSIVSVVTGQVDDCFWDAHVVQAILIGNSSVVEPWALASLPGAGAKHAEVGATAAGHMVAALFEFNHSPAVVAALPTLFFGQIYKPLSLWVFRTVAAGMQFVVAQSADLGLASGTAPIFATMELVHISRLDPLTAALGRTVDAVLCGVLLIPGVPRDLELIVEEVVDVLQRNVVGAAAFGRHMLRVLYGHGKDATET